MNKNKTLIIAEAGVNHNGDIRLAKKLIDVAHNAGADIIKFQVFKTENVISKSAKKADYQKTSQTDSESQFEMVKKLELSYRDFEELKNYCDQIKIEFLATAFDFESLDFLKSMNPPLWKIPSGEITNLPYLEYIGRLNSKVLVSTGMCDLAEVEKALEVLIKSGTKRENISVFHCNTEYPTPYKDVHLNAMVAMQKHLGVEIGYSDHTKGTAVSVAAVALGATVIEKHFTLDQSMKGPDHAASLSPVELKELVTGIRAVELCMGDSIKKPSPSEIKNREIARRSIVANKDITKGDVFSKDNLCAKRPGNGISPMNWYEVLGSQAKRDYKEDELI
jgi:N,N'-diacetyllegionaminate synthase